MKNFKAGKAACKAALQESMGLPVRPEVPLIGFIGRLDDQKGADLILGVMHWLASQDVQVVLLGTGKKELEDGFKWAESAFNDKVGNRHALPGSGWQKLKRLGADARMGRSSANAVHLRKYRDHTVGLVNISGTPATKG